ncbi:hypothetical protein HPB51_019975 [Rhipicephalus microplus]|uniref:Uncharacterized protein n=1 Tax=Rhipicephalus microplus TaxID=6941 RepID=A0A9J6DBK8_RHIMP|nr:hypothetical protein HPB51_019975 [Rhipicephalus microplus]
MSLAVALFAQLQRLCARTNYFALDMSNTGEKHCSVVGCKLSDWGSGEALAPVVSAKLNSSGILFKPDPYVELSVDGGVPVKTEYSKSTCNPKWDEQFPVLVTPYSKLHFRVFNHNSLMKDALLGEGCLELYHVLEKADGKCVGTGSQASPWSSTSTMVIRMDNSGGEAGSWLTATETFSEGASGQQSRQRRTGVPASPCGRASRTTPAAGAAAGAGPAGTPPAAASGASTDEEQLPPGWEVRYDQFNRKYYVDHNTRSTTWERPQPLPPGKRKALSFKEKIEILRKVDEDSKKKHADMVKELGIAPSTLCTIVGQREVILKNAQYFGANVKQAKTATHVKLEDVLLTWFREATAGDVSMVGKVLHEKVGNVALSFGIVNFKASGGWLHRFKERHGLVYTVVSGEGNKVEEWQVNDWLNTLLALISDYTPCM